MDPLFLTPESTLDISIRTTFSEFGAPIFTVDDGGPYRLRTATGREFARIQQVIGRNDVDVAYTLLPDYLVGGVDKDKICQLHPDVVWTVLLEVLKRSRVSEDQAGK